VFENGPELRTIGASALCGCDSLTHIAIPTPVEVIEESALRRYTGCSSRSFHLPWNIERIGEECFKDCFPVHHLLFGSVELLKNIVGDVTLDEALERIGFI
jgi:hypothetical protein